MGTQPLFCLLPGTGPINPKKILTYVNNDCIVNDISQKQCGNSSG